MAAARVCWVGHATVVIEVGATRILIDPLGRARCRSVGRCDGILITHAHSDHLNRWTLRSLDRETRLIVPRGSRPVVDDLGFRSITEIEPGDRLSVGEVEIDAVPTRHPGGRWRRRNLPVPNGYVVAGHGLAVHHAGDIDMSTYECFERIGERFDLDLTFLPVGGFLPVAYYRWRRNAHDRGVHIDPDTALEIATRLGATRMVPVHWGTLHLRLTGTAAPVRRLRKVARDTNRLDRIRVLTPGEWLDLAR